MGRGHRLLKRKEVLYREGKETNREWVRFIVLYKSWHGWGQKKLELLRQAKGRTRAKLQEQYE